MTSTPKCLSTNPLGPNMSWRPKLTCRSLCITV